MPRNGGTPGLCGRAARVALGLAAGAAVGADTLRRALASGLVENPV